VTLFDLNIYPFPPSHAQPQNIPGLLVIPPTRKAARGRENDVLVLYFSLSGSTAITAEGLTAWLEKKAEVYHRNPGTVTAGMRAVIDGINSDLLDRNTRHTKEGGQVSGNLQLAVIKREMLYMVNLGSGKTLYAVNNESAELEDAENNGRGLGVNQTVTPRFVQTSLAPNDVLILSFNAPSAWTGEMLSGASTLSMDVLFRRLYGQPAGSARGIFIRFKEGTGKINLQSLPTGSAASEAKTPEPVAPPAPETQAPIVIPTQFSEPAKPIRIVGDSIPAYAIPEEHTSPAQTNSQQVQPPTENAPAGMVEPARPVNRTIRPEPAEAQTEPNPFAPAPVIQTAAIKSAVGKTLRGGARIKGKMDGFFKDTAQKVLPGEADQPAQFPKSVLIIIAVIIPIIIVAVAFSLYNRNGRAGLFNAYLNQAEQLSVRADGQMSDLPARLASLQESLFWLDKASEYGQSDQSDALRAKLQTSIDDLQGVIRINMVSLLPDALPAEANISQIVATNTDFYALDSTSGTVLRFFVSGSGYEQDNNFACGPSDQALISNIGKVVDMVAISPNNTYGATLLAIDSSGVLEYCVPGDSGYVVSLAAPDRGWASVRSITLYQNYLYVLDIDGNAVYRFEGSGLEFGDKPTLFFDDVIPPLKEAIDIEVVGYELYILRSNGQMVECTYSPLKDMKSTECQDPADYTDTRNGEVTHTTTFSEAQFVLMRLTQAPDSSIYLLDAKGDTVYHFSYARSLQRVLHPRITDGLETAQLTPTAFAISPSRVVFMAYGNELFYGQMP